MTFFVFAATQVIDKGFGLGPFHYFTPWRDLSNGLSSDPNVDHMQKLRSREVGIPTYHFEAHKTVGISSFRVLFRVFFPSMLYVKKAFGIFVIIIRQMRVAITSLLRDKLPPFKQVMLFCNRYSFCNFTPVTESKLIVSLCFFHISMCIILSSHKSESKEVLH